jgi:hypothetical protein
MATSDKPAAEGQSTTANAYLYARFQNLLKYVEGVDELTKLDLSPALGSLGAGKTLTFAELMVKAKEASPEQVRGYIGHLFVKGDPVSVINSAKIEQKHKDRLLRYVECFREVCAL